MTLTGAQVAFLHRALLDGYTPDRLRQMVRIHLDERVEVVAGGANFSAQVMSLIEWAETHDKTAALIAAAHADNPHNTALAQVYRDAQSWFSTAAPAGSPQPVSGSIESESPPVTPSGVAMKHKRLLIIGLAVTSAVLMLLLSILVNLATTYWADALQPYALWIFVLLGLVFVASVIVLIWQKRTEDFANAATHAQTVQIEQRAENDSQIVRSPNRIAGAGDAAIKQSASKRSRIEDSPNTIE